MKPKPPRLTLRETLLYTAALLAVFLLCICFGSVSVPLSQIFAAIKNAFAGSGGGTSYSIIISVRLPRVVCVALAGAALSLCGAAMQGLLRNPLADGSTLGVSSGASLGAIIAIAFGIQIPGIAGGGTMFTAMLFAFLSLLCILGLAYSLDYSLATNTIILIGVVFSMFVNALISLVITFAGERVRPIVFWMMGSLASATWGNALSLFIALLVCGTVIFCFSQELNAFTLGEENARHLGINVRRVKLGILVSVSVLIGVCVSIGGTIGFVGLVVPHITRMLTGPNHRRLLPACLFNGAILLMLADLASRTVLRPKELPVGVVTSLIGAVVFVYVFGKNRGGQKNDG